MTVAFRPLPIFLLAACGGTAAQRPVQLVEEGSNPPSDAREPPSWVLHTPKVQGSVCAVGAVDPTFYRDDGMKNAAEAARDELARTVQVKITSVMYDYQDNSGSAIDQASVQQVVGSISDVVIAGAQVAEYWYDARGSISRQGMTYALACMPTDKSAAEHAEKLNQVMPESEDKEKKIAAVRDRAAAAFEELEKNETRSAQKGADAPAKNASPAPAPQ